MKYTVMDNVKLYLGLRRSGGHWVTIFGAKVAGVKILLPWTNPQNLLEQNRPQPDQQEKTANEKLQELMYSYVR